MDVYEVVIESLDEEARGVGRVEGLGEVRVPGALPGERVAASLVHRAKKRAFLALERVLEASPDRVEVRCPQFLVCGGCDLLHAALPAQHAYKRDVVASALGVEVDPVAASPREYGYRALAKMVVGLEVLGSYAPRSHEVVDMLGCVVHAPEVERVVEALRAALFEEPEIDLRYALVRASLHEGRAAVTLVVREPEAPGVRELGERLGAREDVARVVLNLNPSEGDALLGEDIEVLVDGPAPLEKIGEVLSPVDAGAFAQVNPLAAEVLYRQVVALAEPKGRTILDLYSGSGGIALALADAGAARVFAVEANAQAVEAAKAAAGDRPVEALAASVEDALGTLGPADLVVVNPPRKGLSTEVLHALLARTPLELVYVSCNPESLARDLAWFRARAPLSIARVVPVDLFPHTRHVETVVRATIGAPR